MRMRFVFSLIFVGCWKRSLEYSHQRAFFNWSSFCAFEPTFWQMGCFPLLESRHHYLCWWRFDEMLKCESFWSETGAKLRCKMGVYEEFSSRISESNTIKKNVGKQCSSIFLGLDVEIVLMIDAPLWNYQSMIIILFKSFFLLGWSSFQKTSFNTNVPKLSFYSISIHGLCKHIHKMLITAVFSNYRLRGYYEVIS